VERFVDAARPTRGEEKEPRPDREPAGDFQFARSPADFGKFLAEETEKWAKAVKFSGAKPD
jgi:hypothetical protein